MPTLPQDAHDVLLSAIACDDPVIVIENRTLYAGEKAEIVVGDDPAPIGGHRLRRAGDDVTVVTWGSMTRSVEAAVDQLAAEGATADVIEAVWLDPFDTDAVLASVERTGRLLVCHEANQTGGFGAEVVARVCEAGLPLRTPPRRVATPDLRIPAAVGLAQAAIPQVADIVAALRQVVGR
jgi:pyruvate/2-oxoglutarate/acetoin dehydrogenase E1 component